MEFVHLLPEKILKKLQKIAQDGVTSSNVAS